jgi:hypothetical protein
VCQQEIAFLHAIGFRECDRRGSCHALAMQHSVRELRQRLTTVHAGKEKFFLFNCLRSKRSRCARVTIGTTKCDAGDEQGMHTKIIHRHAGRYAG